MTDKQILTILKYARRKVEVGWAKYHLGQVAYGTDGVRPVNDHLNQASNVCMVGGLVYGLERLCRDWGLRHSDLPKDLVQRLWNQLPDSARGTGRFLLDDLTAYNDSPNTSHYQVLGLFDRTIEEMEGEST